jgi:thiamine transport system permease protein
LSPCHLICSLPLLFLGVFFFYPIAAILRLSFGGATGAGLGALVADDYYARVIWFSAWQAALSTLLTLLLGLPAAYAFARYAFPGKTLLRALATAPFVLPTVVVAAAFNALLGPRGLANNLSQSLFGLTEPPLQIQNTLGAVLLAHVFYNYSVVLRLVGGFWSTLDPRLEQAAAALGANRLRVFSEVTLPLLLPAIGAAALLIFIFTFSSFGIVLILGGPRLATVEVEIYRQTAQLLRLDVAAALALIQMIATLLMTVAYTRLQERSTVPLDVRARAANARPIRTWRARLAVGANIAVILVLLGAPLFALALRSVATLAPDGGWSLTLDYYRELGINRRGSLFFVPPLQAIANSLLFALATTGLSLLIGVPAAYMLANRTKNQERRTRVGATQGSVLGSQFSVLLDPIFMLPLGTSAVTLGLGYILTMGRPPFELLRSPLIIPIAHTLLAFPFVVRSVLPALRGLDPRLREAARVQGAGPLRVLREVDLPLIFPALLVGAVFAFTVSLGEFGATLLLTQPEYPTVPVVIGRFLGQPGELNYGQALALSAILMLVSVLSFAALERLRYRDIGEL